jgi:hypothetical protein
MNQKPGFLGASQAEWFSSGRLLIGEGDSCGEKTWFLCAVVTRALPILSHLSRPGWAGDPDLLAKADD